MIIRLTQSERAHIELARDPGFTGGEGPFQVYTPAGLAEDVAAAANLRSRPGALVLEPSCGRGALIHAALDAQPDLGVIAYDTDPSAINVVSGSTAGADVAVLCRDFLSVTPHQKVDVVLMHPPATADIEHVIHALAWLRRGGKLVAIMNTRLMLENSRTEALRLHLSGMLHNIQEIPLKISGSLDLALLLAARPQV